MIGITQDHQKTNCGSEWPDDFAWFQCAVNGIVRICQGLVERAPWRTLGTGEQTHSTARADVVSKFWAQVCLPSALVHTAYPCTIFGFFCRQRHSDRSGVTIVIVIARDIQRRADKQTHRWVTMHWYVSPLTRRVSLRDIRTTSAQETRVLRTSKILFHIRVATNSNSRVSNQRPREVQVSARWRSDGSGLVIFQAGFMG